MPNAEKQPKLRRRWLRYSLRSFFIVLTMCCLLLGYWVHRAERQRTVVVWIKKNGGYVFYDYEVDEKDVTTQLHKQPRPFSLQGLLGDDYFAAVVHVTLDGTKVPDLAPLAQLEQLKYLSARATQVSDVSPLRKLPHLRFLVLDDTQVRDLRPLAGLTRLKCLYLSHTKVTDVKPLLTSQSLTWLDLTFTPVNYDHIRELRAALPNCEIETRLRP